MTDNPPLSRKGSVNQEPGISLNADAYDVDLPIGYGSSAIVHLALYKPTNTNVAIKIIDLEMFERNQIDELRREIQIMCLSKHPNLLPVHGSFVVGNKLYIVTPFLSGGSCLDIMKTAFIDGFEESIIASILKQALQGLEYLHKNGLVHRDVKAGNLLVAQDGVVQLADFGVSNSLTDSGNRRGLRKTFVGTPCWMAPEVMEQSGYEYKADIWSFGITAIELATGHAPYAKYPPMKVLMLTLQNDPPTLDRERTRHKYSKVFKDMIDSCLMKDPTKRPTAEKLLQHPFFKSAKKSSYVASILQGLVPITQRAHNRRPQPLKTDNVRTGESWNFEDIPQANSFDVNSPSSIGLPLQKEQFDIESGTPSSVGVPSKVQFDVSGKKSRFIYDEKESTEPNSDKKSTTLDTATTPSISTITQQPGEVKKGRFTVNDTSSPTSLNNSLNSSQLSLKGESNLGSTGSLVSKPSIKQEDILSDTLLERKRSGNSINETVNPNTNGKPSRFTLNSSQDNQTRESSPHSTLPNTTNANVLKLTDSSRSIIDSLIPSEPETKRKEFLTMQSFYEALNEKLINPEKKEKQLEFVKKVFEEQDIEVNIISRLDDLKLKDAGIVQLGLREAILKVLGK